MMFKLGGKWLRSENTGDNNGMLLTKRSSDCKAYTLCQKQYLRKYFLGRKPWFRGKYLIKSNQ